MTDTEDGDDLDDDEKNGGMSDDYITDAARESAFDTCMDLADTEEEANRLFTAMSIDILRDSLSGGGIEDEVSVIKFVLQINDALLGWTDYQLVKVETGHDK